MFWRYAAASGRTELIRNLLRIFHELLIVHDGHVESALEHLEWIADRYTLWPSDFGLAEFRQLIEERREVRVGSGGGLELTHRGERAMRRQALEDVFQKLKPDGRGGHRTPIAGGVGDPTDETRPWTFGDNPGSIDASRTLSNWLRRTGGAGVIAEDDLEVRERERNATCATVLLIDISHSMTLYGEDRMTPAKRVALALTELILTRFPKDSLDVVLFGDEAMTVPLEQLPYITNGPYHTNTRAGLIMAQEILRRRKASTRQIVLLTDGKPSAIHEDGRIYKNPFGLDPRITARTLDEAMRCRRKDIQVTTFMLTTHPELRRFVERFTEVGRGRAYFAEGDRLDSFVLVDFLRNRRRRVR